MIPIFSRWSPAIILGCLNAIAFVCLLCEIVVQSNLAARSEGGVEHTQKVARARGEQSLVELHADPHRPRRLIYLEPWGTRQRDRDVLGMRRHFALVCSPVRCRGHQQLHHHRLPRQHGQRRSSRMHNVLDVGSKIVSNTQSQHLLITMQY